MNTFFALQYLKFHVLPSFEQFFIVKKYKFQKFKSLLCHRACVVSKYLRYHEETPVTKLKSIFRCHFK